MEELTQHLLKELFDYKDGELYWKVKKAHGIKMGDLAGVVMKGGYRHVGINGKLYYAHRLIFLYHNGYLPEFIDHIDCDKLNNDINNLREATMRQNNTNVKKQAFYNGKSTSSIYKGVCWDKRAKKWMAQIMSNGELKYLGVFTFETEAAKAYNKVAIKSFGKFAKLNEV